jgi:hypothetical protein
MDRMELAAHLRLAQASHAMWRHLLASALGTGRTARPVDEVRREDACDFGAWLLGTERLRESPAFAPVRELHLRFHEEAARALELVLDGQPEAAERALSDGGPFDRASRDLEDALERWAGLEPGSR